MVSVGVASRSRKKVNSDMSGFLAIGVRHAGNMGGADPALLAVFGPLQGRGIAPAYRR
jgi:hypothetical protein